MEHHRGIGEDIQTSHSTVPLPSPVCTMLNCSLCKTKRDIDDISGKEVCNTISAEDIRKELGIVIMEEQKVQLSKMRSVDEGQTTFYNCTRCGHKFQEN